MILRVHAAGFRRLRHFLTVLVSAGQKQHVVARKPMISGKHVRNNGRIRVSQMRLVVYIVYRGCYVEPPHSTNLPRI